MLKPTEPKKVLCIHDLSGVGRCSLAVILPVLSVMGVQPVALPTVVLSTHTWGFGTPSLMDGAAYGMLRWSITTTWGWTLRASTPATSAARSRSHWPKRPLTSGLRPARS